MSGSAFDLDGFMSQPADAGTTSIAPIPEGEYLAIIDDVKPRVVNTKNGEAMALDVFCLLQDEALKKTLGRETLTVKAGFFLAMNGSKLDMSAGKTTRLNRLPEALGQTDAGWTPGKLKGAGPVKVKVSQRVDGDVIYNDIKSFGKAK